MPLLYTLLLAGDSKMDLQPVSAHPALTFSRGVDPFQACGGGLPTRLVQRPTGAKGFGFWPERLLQLTPLWLCQPTIKHCTQAT